MKNASSSTNSPAMNKNISTSAIALATGLRSAITKKPHDSIAMLKNQNNVSILNMSWKFIESVPGLRLGRLAISDRRIRRIQRRRAFVFPLPNRVWLDAAEFEQLLFIELQFLAVVAGNGEI